MSLTSNDLNQIKTVVNEQLHEVVREVVHEVVHEVVYEAIEPLATKADLDRLEQRLVFGSRLFERETNDRIDNLTVRVSRLEQAR